MKKIGYLLLALLFGLKSIGQDMNDENKSIFEIKYYDEFSFMNSEPNPKEGNFELMITKIDERKFEACYSKELVNCLFGLNDLRKSNISLNEDGVCFSYFLTENNTIEIIDKTEVVKYIEKLNNFKSANFKKKQLKQLLGNVDFYLEYDDELDKDLKRELELIHEYENMDIPIGLSGTIDEEEEEVNFEELKKGEIDFLNQIDWENINRIDVYRTPEINNSEFLFDYMFGIDMLTADERADFEAISKAFFDGNLNVSDYDNVTLNRDQRHLNKDDKKLSYLLKERKSVSPKMRKITRIEITKK